MTDATGLLAWSRESLRDLPWRRTRDSWLVLVSETMLQQTQVSRVQPRFEQFVERFPTVTACADAGAAAVIELWEGLGHNRRAVSLHAAAVACVERHGGQVPDRLAELLALPGVGPYTARAVLAFAFEQDVGVVDTNVGRVLARAYAGRPLGGRDAQVLADELVPTGEAWRWNQALMELGAVLCRKRAPQCEACPMVGSCAWAVAGRPEPDPAVGSAAVSGRQSRFDGSDRQGRGRLVAALRRGPVPVAELADVMGWPGDPGRVQQVAKSVVDDGLAVRSNGRLALPG